MTVKKMKRQAMEQEKIHEMINLTKHFIEGYIKAFSHSSIVIKQATKLQKWAKYLTDTSQVSVCVYICIYMYIYIYNCPISK